MTIVTGDTTTLKDAPGLPDSPAEATQELVAKTDTETDPDGLLAELSETTLTPAERLENKFALINQWTIDETKLESRILRITTTDPRTKSNDDEDSTSNSIYAVYWLPTEEVAIEEFEKPVPWDPDRFKFAEIVEEIGYNAGTIDHVEGEPVVIENTNGEWGIVDPDDTDIHPGKAELSENATPPLTLDTLTAAHVKTHTKQGIRDALQTPIGLRILGVPIGVMATAAIYAGILTINRIYGAITAYFETMIAEAEAEGGEEEVPAELINMMIADIIPFMIMLTVFFVAIQMIVKLIRPNKPY